METVRFLRMLRRRWKLITLLVLGGALLGSLAAARELNKPEPVAERVFFAADHELLLEPDADRATSLDQIAHLLTGGELPTIVAEELDLNRSFVIPRVLTLIDHGIGSLTVSAVGETPDAALELTNTFADGLVAYLLAQERLEYDALLSDAEDLVGESLAELEALDRRIQRLQPALDEAGEPVPLTTAQATQLELLMSERTATVRTYENALSEADRIRTELLPTPVLETFEVSEPYTISERAHSERLADGRTGQATYTRPEDVPTGQSTSRFSADGLGRNPVVLVVGGTLAGLLLAILAVATMTRLDHRILSRGEAEEHFGLPVIAEIPKYRRRDRKSTELVAFTERMSHVAESYRSLRSSLMYSAITDGADRNADAPDADDNHAQVVMVTSPGAGEGKTTVTANLAVVIAEGGHSVLAINCDYRRPKLAFHLGGDHAPRRLSPTVVPGVVMINHATDDGPVAVPSEALAAQRRLIERGRRRVGNDVILLDTAPLLATNDANELIPSCDLVVVIAHLGRTTKEAAQATRDLLQRRGAPVAGVVLVGTRDTAIPKRYYYYTSDVTKRLGGNGSDPFGGAAPAPPGVETMPPSEPLTVERELVSVAARRGGHDLPEWKVEMASLPFHAVHDEPWDDDPTSRAVDDEMDGGQPDAESLAGEPVDEEPGASERVDDEPDTGEPADDASTSERLADDDAIEEESTLDEPASADDSIDPESVVAESPRAPAPIGEEPRQTMGKGRRRFRRVPKGTGRR